MAIQWGHVRRFDMRSGIWVRGMQASAGYNRNYNSYSASVTKGGEVSTGGRDKTYGNYTRGVCVCVSQRYRKHSTKGMLTPHMAKGGRVSTGGQGESGRSITGCG